MLNDIKKIFTQLDSKIVNKIYLIFVLMVSIIGLEVFGISLVIPFLNSITEPDYLIKKKELLNLPQNLSFLNAVFEQKIFLILLIIFYLFKNFLLGFLIFLKTKFIFSIQKKLSSNLFKIYLYKNFFFHLNNNSALLIRNVTDEVGAFVQNFLVSVLDLILEVFVFIAIFLLLLYIEPFGASFIALTFLIVGFLFYKTFRKKIQFLGQERQYHDGEKLKRLFQSFQAIKEVKILNIEKELINQFNFNNFKSLDIGRKRFFLLQVPKLIFEIFAIFSLIFLVFINLDVKTNTALIPIIGAFTAAAFRMVPSINKIISSLQNIKFSYPSIKVIRNEIFNENSKDNNIDKDLNKKVYFDKFELKNISFKYSNDQQEILKNINLTIKRGDKIGIIGKSGAGKTTLVDIILGLLDQSQGSKLLNNGELIDGSKDWQNIIAYVPQDVFLLDDTLKSNVAFGVKEEKIDNEKLLLSLSKAQLKDLVQNRKHGINTSLGEGGLKISGGQRQRVGIARALYSDPDVIIFDEATSSLDHMTESKILDEIELNLKGKTIIMITHRENSLKFFDKIYEIKDSMLITKKKSVNE